MSVHHIRLKGPWEYEWLSPCAAVPTEGVADETGGIIGRVQMPCDWRTVFGRRTGRARFSRVFHSPTGLDPGDIVRLVFAGVGGRMNVHLNDELLVPAPIDERSVEERGLASSDEQRNVVCDITSQLRGVNQLTVEIEFDPQAQPESPGGLFDPITIEIVGASAGSGK